MKHDYQVLWETHAAAHQSAHWPRGLGCTVCDWLEANGEVASNTCGVSLIVIDAPCLRVVRLAHNAAGAAFYDEATHATYNPASYPNHGTGLFFVGLEGNGSVYGYALNHADNTYTRTV